MARHSARLRAQTPGRVEGLQDGKDRFNFGTGGAELLRDHREVAREIARLVHEIDQILPDHAPGRIGDRERKLLGEMIGKRHLGGNPGLQIVVLRARPPCAGPFR